MTKEDIDKAYAKKRKDCENRKEKKLADLDVRFNEERMKLKKTYDEKYYATRKKGTFFASLDFTCGKNIKTEDFM